MVDDAWKSSFAATAAWLVLAVACPAQDLEPRRWSHLPIGRHFLGAGYAFTNGDISVDPVLQLEDVTVDMHTAALKYLHSFGIFGKSARFDLIQAYQNGTWNGLLEGVPTEVRRDGWTDSALRFSINLYGAPPLEGPEFMQYRAAHAECETIVGAAVILILPTGEYFPDRLINLGGNRFVLRPQFGVVHNRGKWSMELTGAASFYQDNDEFWNGRQREQDPMWSIESHLIHTFAPGLWLSGGLGFDTGGRSTINGVEKDDYRNQATWALTLGVPLSRQVGLKFSYLGSRTLEDTGMDLDSVAAAISFMW